MTESKIIPSLSPTPPYLCIYGATGSGKSQLAMAIAARVQGEIINADSVQFYRGFNIGAAKPSDEDLRLIPHHLLDIVTYHEDFTAANFAETARRTIAEVHARGKLPIVVGGSGLYLRCLWGEKFHELPHDDLVREALKVMDSETLYSELKERDPLRAAALHPNDRLRVMRSLEVCRLSEQTYSELTGAEKTHQAFPPRAKIFLNPAKAELQKTLKHRLTEMFHMGLIDEVRSLLAEGCPVDAKPMQSIGYKQVADYLDGTISDEATLCELIFFATRQYAKRQLTWFKKVRSDIEIQRGDSAALEQVLAQLRSTYAI